MNRRQLAFIVLVNAFVSLVVALLVVWIVELRRPDPEELAALFTPAPQSMAVRPATDSSATGQIVAPASTSVVPEQTENSSTPIAQPVENSVVYVVRDGDILSTIATRFNVSMQEIMDANNLDNPDRIFSGQRLAIPGVDDSAALGQESAPVSTASTPIVEPPSSDGIQISAVDGVGNLDAELVLIVNDSDNSFNLQGWTLGREGGPVYRFGTLPLFPGGSVRVLSRAGSDTSIDLFWGRTAPVWQSNSKVRLVNAQGTLVKEFIVP